MRGLTMVLCLGWLVGGCTTTDASPVFVDMTYQVRCITCEPRSPDNPVRDLNLLDGEQGHTVRCRASKRTGDRLITFSTTYIDPNIGSDSYAIEIFEANLDDDNPGNTCEIIVKEGNNTYKGRCTSGEPDEDAACQVKLEVEGDVVHGSLLCLEMPNQVNSTTFRRVVNPGKDVEKPASFEIHGCVGL
jgi:hypothetical protein